MKGELPDRAEGSHTHGNEHGNMPPRMSSPSAVLRQSPFQTEQLFLGLSFSSHYHMKYHLPFILFILTLLTACSEDENPAANPDNANANPSVIPEALNLETPRLDGQAGDFYAHYATDARGTRTLNYTLEWCPEKKHSRWVAFIFTNTTAAIQWNCDNWKGAEWEVVNVI